MKGKPTNHHSNGGHRASHRRRGWRRRQGRHRDGPEHRRIRGRQRRNRGGGFRGGCAAGDGNAELLGLVAVALDAAGEEVVAGLGYVEEGVAIVHVQDRILQAAAVEGLLRHLDH